jgi:hypothetical protein
MEHFLEDILNQLIEEAFRLKKIAVDDFSKGEILGYYHSISKILNQAEAFGLYDKLTKNLQEFNPEELLCNLGKN